MRIVNIVTQMEAGGAQQAAVHLASALQNRGHESEVWFLYMKRPTYQNDSRIRTILNRKPAGLVDILFIFYGLIKLIHWFRPDAVITHTYYANIIGQLAACIFGVRARLAVQHNPVYTYPGTARFLDYFMGSLGFYKNNVTVSKTAFDSFNSYPVIYKKRLKIINNGIFLREPELSQANARRRFGLPVDCPLVVNVGRLAAQKNQRLLIHILEHLPEVRLAVAGEGELRSFLEEEAVSLNISERVFLIGEISPSDIADFLTAGNIFVFPSLFEALPYALVEAMAAGLPVIASDIPSIRDVISGSDPEQAGILVCLNNEEEFRKAIQKVLKDSELARHLSGLAKERAAEFNFNTMIDNYEQLLDTA